MLSRRAALTSAIGLAMTDRFALGESLAQVRLVGMLGFGSSATSSQFYDLTKHAMRELGWVEGRNIEYRMAFAEFDLDRIDALARGLVAERVDVLLAGTTQAVKAAQKATRSVPIVMVTAFDPLGNKFIASYSHPGTNITGLTTLQEGTHLKTIDLLHQVVPSARRVAILLNDRSPTYSALWSTSQAACIQLNIEAIKIVANASDQFEAAVAQIVREKAQAVVVIGEPLFDIERVRLAKLVNGTSLPAAYGWREYVVLGGLLSYGNDIFDNFRRAAGYVDKILRGAKPDDLPVEEPTRFKLSLNLKTAKALGIAIPRPILLSADELIE